MDDLAHVKEAIENARKGFPRSPIVKRFIVYDDLDSTGDPSIYIWVLFDDRTPETEQDRENVLLMQSKIAEAIRKTGEKRWPYIRFRTESEYQEMVEA